MAPTLVHYRKVLGNVGYRFTLPVLDPPPASGEVVDVEVAIFSKDPSRALHEQYRAAERPSERKDVEDLTTLDVFIAGATWLLPVLSPSGSKDVEHHLARTRRLPATQQGAAGAPFSSSDAANALMPPSASAPASRLPTAPGRHISSRASTDSASSAEPEIDRRDFLNSFRSLTESDYETDESEDGYDVEELGINRAYGNHISRTRYVDVLYRGDEPLATAKRLIARLENPSLWSINIELGTWFRRASVPSAKRSLDWQQLTRRGLPCRVKGNSIDIVARGFTASGLTLTTKRLADGEARFKLVPMPADRAVHPAAASAHASHIISLYVLTVQQGDTLVQAYAPHARPVDENWDHVLRELAEYSSAETGQSLIYSEEPRIGRVLEEVMGFGVRLRDGGSRLPLRASKSDEKMVQMQLPGLLEKPATTTRRAAAAPAVSSWELFESRSSSKKRAVDVRLPATPERRDIILRAVERADGDYQNVEYALRAQGIVTPIKEEEWQALTTELVEDTTLLHILNAARVTFGRPILEELPTAQDTSQPKDKKPRLA